MAFFDNFKEKLTETTQSIVDKGQEAAEIVRVKAQIMEEQKKLNDWYQMLGKKYVEMHGDAPEEALSAAVTEIRVIQAKIDALKSESEEEKTVKEGPAFCPACGAQLDGNAKFCKVCGAQVK